MKAKDTQAKASNAADRDNKGDRVYNIDRVNRVSKILNVSNDNHTRHPKHGWEVKKLGEVGTIIGGSTPKTSEPSYWNGEHFWVTPAELDGSKYISSTSRTITNEGVKSAHLQLLPPGTILLSSRAPIGKVAITRVPMYSNQGFKNLICADNLYNEYAYWFLYHNTEYLNSLGTGATFKEISKRIVEQIPIPIPGIEEQERIVRELDCLSGVIEKKREQLKQLDALAQSIFYDMFGDPIINEKGWEVDKLGNLGEIIAGSTPSTTDDSNWGGNINWVTPAELNEQLYYGETIRKITEKAAKSLTLMPIGTVLLSSRAPIGKLAITTTPMCCNQGFKNIICSNRINNVFLYHYLKLTIDDIKALGRGATFKEVSKKNISDYKIYIPPLSLQEEFAEKIEAIEKQKELLKRSIKEVETLFDARMDYYFGDT